jgi:hypothetical protein
MRHSKPRYRPRSTKEDKPNRIQIDIAGLRDIMETLAEKERRSLATMSRILIEEALQYRGIMVDSDSIGELTRGWKLDLLAEEADILLKNLEEIVAGTRRPTDGELVRLARALERDTRELILIRAKQFGQ